MLFISFLAIAIGVTLFMAMGPQGSSGPAEGFFSWAFLFFRSADMSFVATLLTFSSYFLGLVSISTFLAYLRKQWGLAVPIAIHGVGTTIAALTFGPFLVEEKTIIYLVFLILSLGTTLVYFWIDWLLALAAVSKKDVKGSSTE